MSWRWDLALFGVVCAVPAVAVALVDPESGLAVALGALLAISVGIPPRRRRRIATLAAGVVVGVGFVVGSIVGPWAWIAVPALLIGTFGAVRMSEGAAVGRVVLFLGLPLFAAGFSFAGELATTATIAAVLAATCAFAWLVSLAWPERIEPAPPAQPREPPAHYTLRLGLVGGIAAVIGYASGWSHVGWAPAAGMLVMRPDPGVALERSIGRTVSVVGGAVLALLLTTATSSAVVYAIAVLAVLAIAGGTQSSRWYVSGGYATFLALSLFWYSSAPSVDTALGGERIVATGVGVGLALLLGPGYELVVRRRQKA